jgi:hypothetical protein
LVRTSPSKGTSAVRFRHLWGREKRARLLETAVQDGESLYEQVLPALSLGLPFSPVQVALGYLSWPLLPDLFPVSFPGVKTSRDDVVVDIDRERLVARMKAYFDPGISDEEMARIAPRAMEETGRFAARRSRDYLLKRGLKPENVVSFCYRPFDIRYLYWEPETKLLDEKRSQYFSQIFDDNLWLGAAQRNRRDFDPPFVSPRLCSLHVIEWSANFFPLWLKHGKLLESEGTVPNLSDQATAYLARLCATPPDLFFHVVATLHAPAYAADNAGALLQNWPRVPLPASKEALLASPDLGRRLAQLLDPECAVKGVTDSPIRPELRVIGSTTGATAQLDPDSGDLDVTASWGHAGRGGITMPAQGKVVERPYDPKERVAIEHGVKTHGLPPEEAITLLGETTLDVYLNERTYWKNIPARVWEFKIGGYQVIKKWLSYREKDLLGRSLTVQEARHVTGMARRIAAILLLGPELDANYEAVKRAPYEWTSSQKLAR